MPFCITSTPESLTFNQEARSLAHPKWTLGTTHSLHYEEPYGDRLSVQTKGALFGTLSYAVRRDVRLRINLLAKYHNSTGDRDTGVTLQLCFGCGLNTLMAVWQNTIYSIIQDRCQQGDVAPQGRRRTTISARPDTGFHDAGTKKLPSVPRSTPFSRMMPIRLNLML